MPKCPKDLWTKFKQDVSEDLRRTHGDEEGTRMAYALIVEHLASMGKSLADFPDMPQLEGSRWSLETIDVVAEIAEARRLYEKLNRDQKAIVDEVIAALANGNPSRARCYYVDGPAGVGKSFTYK